MAVRAELMEANRPVDPKSTVKNMFVMNATGADKPINKYVGSKDFQTSNGFYHGLTKESSDQLRHTDLHTTAGATAALGCEVDPDVLKVAACRVAKIWSTKQYRDPEHTDLLSVTVNRGT